MSLTTTFDRLTTLILLGLVGYFAMVVGPSIRTRPEETGVGGALPVISGVRYETSAKTVVLSLRSTCQFCTNSMPFYRKLVDTRNSSGAQFRVVAISTEPAAQLNNYLADHGVFPDSVSQVVPADWRDHLRTPTLLLVDSRGVLTGKWTGQLFESQEVEVETKLQLRPARWWLLGM